MMRARAIQNPLMYPFHLGITHYSKGRVNEGVLLRVVVSRSSQNVEQGHGMEWHGCLARANDMEQLQKGKYSVFVLMHHFRQTGGVAVM